MNRKSSYKLFLVFTLLATCLPASAKQINDLGDLLSISSKDAGVNRSYVKAGVGQEIQSSGRSRAIITSTSITMITKSWDDGKSFTRIADIAMRTEFRTEQKKSGIILYRAPVRIDYKETGRRDITTSALGEITCIVKLQEVVNCVIGAGERDSAKMVNIGISADNATKKLIITGSIVNIKEDKIINFNSVYK